MPKTYNLKKNRVFTLQERDENLKQLKKQFKRNINRINNIRISEKFPTVSTDFNLFIQNIVRAKIAYGSKAEQAIQVAYSVPQFNGKRIITDFGNDKLRRADNRYSSGGKNITWSTIFMVNYIEEYSSSAGNEVYQDFNKNGEEWIDFFETEYYDRISSIVSGMLKNKALLTRNIDVLLANLKVPNK